MKSLTIFLIFITFGLFSCKTRQNIPMINYSKESISTPIPFAQGIISTDENSEFDLTFSTDGLKTYFSRRKPNERQMIYESDFENGNWTTPKLSEFSNDRDETASISPNGKYFFFGSERQIPNKPNKGNFDMNIWMMEKTKVGWSKPKPLPEPINQVQIEKEEWPSSNNNFFFTNDNKTYYFTTMKRGTKSIKLYETKFNGKYFTEPKTINGIFEDEKFWIYSAVISPDGKFLIFNSFQAPGGEGGEDIFVSKKTENGWSKAKSIGKLVNTKDEESSPRFSRDGKYFFFSRAKNFGNYEYGEWSIFYVETKYLNLDKI